MFSFPCIIVWICFVCCIRAPPHTLVCVRALEWVSECRFGNMNQLDVSCCICSYTNKFLVYSGMLDKRKTLDKYVQREKERKSERIIKDDRRQHTVNMDGWMDVSTKHHNTWIVYGGKKNHNTNAKTQQYNKRHQITNTHTHYTHKKKKKKRKSEENASLNMDMGILCACLCASKFMLWHECILEKENEYSTFVCYVCII